MNEKEREENQVEFKRWGGKVRARQRMEHGYDTAESNSYVWQS